MPAHAVLGIATLMVSGAAASGALLYVTAPSARTALRLPLVATVGVAFALSIAAGEAGKALLDAVKASGSADEATAASAHAHGSDLLTVALFALLVATLATLWKGVSPAQGRWSIAAAAVALCAAATLVGDAAVLVQALDAVSAGHPSWQG